MKPRANPAPAPPPARLAPPARGASATARTSPRDVPGLHSPGAGFDEPYAMLDACHDRVRRSLALLLRLIAHLQARGVDADARSAAADVRRYFDLAAPAHHEDEERHVIPRLQASPDPALQAAAQRMQDDHRDFRAVWARLGPALGRVAAAADGPMLPDEQAGLAREAERFVAMHAPHLALEDDLAFPAASAGTDAEARRLMGREMAARRR